MIRDITRTLRRGFPAWPGDPPLEIETVASLDRGDPFTISRLTISLHAGTHLDAPSHALREGADVGSVPLGRLIGPARVIHAPGRLRIDAADLGALHASASSATHTPAGPRRILLRTESAETLPDLPDRFAALTPEAADLLVRSGVELVGIDTPSVDPPEGVDPAAHRAFARASVAVLEWLDLRGVPPGEYFLIALPLRIEGAEASPVRAVLLDGPSLSIDRPVE